MNVPCFLTFVILSIGANNALAESSESIPRDLEFCLTVTEVREERKNAPDMTPMPDLTFESEMTLFGRLRVRAVEGRKTVVVYADSLLFDSRSPYVFRTFMSIDTMCYDAPGGQSAINRRQIAKYDSMLTCVFDGPALEVRYSEMGVLEAVEHFNASCESGEYDRLNLPVTLGAFLPDSAMLGGGGMTQWRECRAVPSFSGVGFYPSLDMSYRVVDVKNGKVTIVVSADSTIDEHRTRMKNGEDIVILSDRLRVGGTLVIDTVFGIPRSGEIRVRELLELLRPRVSHAVSTKNGEYSIRFSIQ